MATPGITVYVGRSGGRTAHFGVRRQAATTAATGTQDTRCRRNIIGLAQPRRRFGCGLAGNQSAVAAVPGNAGCQVPCDYIPRRSYPPLEAREALRLLAGEGAEGNGKAP